MSVNPEYGSTVSSPSVPDEIVLTDPRSVRALAHPVRLMVIDELYSGEVLTATELAQRAGISPSAMSYHLRHLESFGLVRRAPARGDGRERPWERTARDVHIDVARGSASAAVSATRMLVQESVRHDVEQLLADASGGHRSRWSHYSRARVVATEDEMRTVLDAIDALLNQYRDRSGAALPAGARPATVSVMAVRQPAGDEGSAVETRAGG